MKAIAKNNIKLVLLVVSAFLLMSAVSYFYVASVIKNRINLYSAKEVALYRSSLEGLLRANEDALTHAEATMVLALDRSAPSNEMVTTLRALNQAFSRQNNLETVFASVYGFIDGNFIDGYGLVPGAFFNTKTATWLRGAYASDGGVHLTEPYIDNLSGRVTAALSKVVRDSSGRERGVLAVDFRLEPIVERVVGFRLGRAGYGFLLSRSLVVLAHPDPEMVGRPLSEVTGLGELAGLAASVSGDALAAGSFMGGGEEHVAFIGQLGNGWRLGSVSPLSYYYGEVFRLVPVIVVIGLILASVLSVVLVRLSLAKTQSEEESRSKSSFLARMSHEIRTPMNAIMGLSELAHRDFGQPQSLGYIVEIRRAGAILLGLINDILDYSKLESGKFRVIESDYQLGRLISDVLAIVRLRAADKSLALLARVAPGLPRGLLGDARGIRQVLVNLLSNAIKYTPSGFVRLSVSKRSVSDQVVELVFTVEDSGIGISEEDQSRLFDDFVQLSHDKFDHYVEGTGLGLVISRSLCRLMGGDISVESVLGRGSAFTATVRQVVVDPSPLDPEDGKLSDILAPKSPASFTAPGCRVLVVDDIATNLTVASGLLAPYQMDVATCLSGEEAVRLEERERFDLIFIDQMMPGLDGVETLKALRALGEDRAATPMVALTANAMAGVKEALLAQGFDDYLSKPIDSGELDFILDKWVQPVARLAAPDGGPGGQEAANMPFFAPVLARGGIDARTGLSRCGGSVEVFEKILKAFLRDVERLAPSLASADAAEAPAIVISVHAIKSASANIGALTLSAEAAAIEANLKAGLTDDIDSGRLAALRRSLLDMAGAVREALAAAEAARGDGGGDGAGAGELGRLKEALLAGDVGLSDKLVDTLSRKGDGPTRSVLERVSYHVLVSDYQEAARLVGDLMAGAAAEEARD